MELFRPREVAEVYYRYDANGWNVSNAGACTESEYASPETWASAASQSSERLAQGVPVAAGAVVCLDLLK
jgi:hypothetical protein